MAQDEGLGDTFEFFQFSSATAPQIPNINFVETEVSSASRYVAIDLLKKHQIDIVAMLAPWPETFSYVVHEAIAAGCQVICLKNSGNVARIVQSTGRGLVFDTEEALTEFLKTRGLEWVLACRQRRVSYTIDNCGTTATYLPVPEGLSQ
jgi:glycosyltransferase involved in cell wall biosynthesis